MFLKIGTDQSDDILIYENSDKPRWSFGISVLKDSDIKVLSIFTAALIVSNLSK